jgi:hypothetical protein
MILTFILLKDNGHKYLLYNFSPLLIILIVKKLVTESSVYVLPLVPPVSWLQLNTKSHECIPAALNVLLPMASMSLAQNPLCQTKKRRRQFSPLICVLPHLFQHLAYNMFIPVSQLCPQLTRILNSLIEEA